MAFLHMFHARRRNARNGGKDCGAATQANVTGYGLCWKAPPTPTAQKWMITSLAAMTAQFLVGAIPAAALPLKALLSTAR